MQFVISIIRRDWLEYRKPILLLTAGMFLPLLVSERSADFSKGMMTGILASASYSFAYFCFSAERQRGTLQLLLGLPARPFDLVLAKYASLYSMALFTANVPGIFLHDVRALFILDAYVLLFATASMAGSVISDKPWAPVLPLWVGLVFFLPIQKILLRFYPHGLGLYNLVTSHTLLFATLALALTPIIALASAFWFHSRS